MGWILHTDFFALCKLPTVGYKDRRVLYETVFDKSTVGVKPISLNWEITIEKYVVCEYIECTVSFSIATFDSLRATSIRNTSKISTVMNLRECSIWVGESIFYVNLHRLGICWFTDSRVNLMIDGYLTLYNFHRVKIIMDPQRPLMGQYRIR